MLVARALKNSQLTCGDVIIICEDGTPAGNEDRLEELRSEPGGVWLGQPAVGIRQAT